MLYHPTHIPPKTFSSWALQATADLGVPCAFYWLSPGSILVAASFTLQCGLPHVHPGPAQATTNRRSLCSSQQVVPGWSQAASDTGLHLTTGSEMAPLWSSYSQSLSASVISRQVNLLYDSMLPKFKSAQRLSIACHMKTKLRIGTSASSIVKWLYWSCGVVFKCKQPKTYTRLK